MAGASFAANGPRPFPPPYAHVMLKGFRRLTTAPATPWDSRPATVGGGANHAWAEANPNTVQLKGS